VWGPLRRRERGESERRGEGRVKDKGKRKGLAAGVVV